MKENTMLLHKAFQDLDYHHLAKWTTKETNKIVFKSMFNLAKLLAKRKERPDVLIKLKEIKL